MAGATSTREPEDTVAADQKPKSPRVAVIGAAGVGLVYRVSRWPNDGETLLAEECRIMCGGKAANQAMAVAKLGGQVVFVSALGKDQLAGTVDAAMRRFGVDATHIERLDVPTLTGAVIVSADGSNRIVVDPGAVGRITAEQIRRHESAIVGADLCLVSGDGFPDHAALAALEIAKKSGVPTIYNPAPPPSPEMTTAILVASSMVTPNLEEARILADERSDDPESLADRILARGARSVVITLGAEGAFVRDPRAGVRARVPTRRYESVVDTSGAGDAFNGALAWAIAGGSEIVEAVRFACAAAALITQGPGLIESLHLWDGLSRPEPMAAKEHR